MNELADIVMRLREFVAKNSYRHPSDGIIKIVLDDSCFDCISHVLLRETEWGKTPSLTFRLLDAKKRFEAFEVCGVKFVRGEK